MSRKPRRPLLPPAMAPLKRLDKGRRNASRSQQGVQALPLGARRAGGTRAQTARWRRRGRADEVGWGRSAGALGDGSVGRRGKGGCGDAGCKGDGEGGGARGEAGGSARPGCAARHASKMLRDPRDSRGSRSILDCDARLRRFHSGTSRCSASSGTSTRPFLILLPVFGASPPLLSFPAARAPRSCPSLARSVRRKLRIAKAAAFGRHRAHSCYALWSFRDRSASGWRCGRASRPGAYSRPCVGGMGRSGGARVGEGGGGGENRGRNVFFSPMGLSFVFRPVCELLGLTASGSVCAFSIGAWCGATPSFVSLRA